MTPESAPPEERPLIEHFTELRRCLMRALIAYALAVLLCYHYAADIYAFLVRPLAESFPDPTSRRMIYTSLIEAFFTYLKLAMFAGFILAFPVIATQVYLFLAPGLYKRERKLLIPYLIAAPALFLCGAALCYYGIFPVAWKFFLSFETPPMDNTSALSIQLDAKVSEYLGLVTHLLLAFGLSFQLPVIMALLTHFGLVHAAAFAQGRRYAVVIIVAVAAVITPPDIFSQVALSVPIYVLYELSIHCCRWIEHRQKNATALEP